MKLYFAPRTRSVRPRWLLEELEVPYELERISGPVDLSPLGELPVLIDGDTTLFTSSAICLYLADRFIEKKLAPPVGAPERGDYLQWVIFAEHVVEPAFEAHAREPGERFAQLLSVVERRVTGREFIVGGSFTAADLVMASILHRATAAKIIESGSALYEYVHRHASRSAIRRALA